MEEDDEPSPPPQKIIPRVQVVQQQASPPQQAPPLQAVPQQRHSASYPQPPQAQQVSPRPVAQQATQTVNVEGEARVRYNFKAETQRELPCNKVKPCLPVAFILSSWLFEKIIITYPWM